MIILSCCFLVMSAFIYLQLGPEQTDKTVRLSTALNSIPGWETGQALHLDPRVARELDVDDYLLRNYRNHEASVDLYVGYYCTSAKVGAAHDAVVCFSGQGWALSGRDKGKLALNGKLGDSISYSRMLAERNSQKVLIVYWFQSYDETNADPFSQKVSLFWKKLTERRGNNAFVRVSMALGDRAVEEGMNDISNFIKAFYPAFLRYIRQGNAGNFG
jgi:EpsI family protein